MLVFINQDRDGICKLMDDAGITIFGSTTNGGFIDKTVLEGASAIQLLDIKPDYFSIHFEDSPNKNCRKIARGLAKKTLEQFSNPAFLIAGSNMETNADQLIFGFEDIKGSKINRHGCIAGDDFSFLEQ